MKGVVLCMKKLHFISLNWRKENSTVASGSSPILIYYFDYPKRFINRINEAYDFSHIYILCTISLAISYVSHLFCAHLRAVPINFNCNDENRILGN